MRPIRLGVIFDQELKVGGGFQQSLNAALLAQKLPNDLANLFFYTTLEANINILLKNGIKARLIKFSILDKFFSLLRRKLYAKSIRRILRLWSNFGPLEKVLTGDDIDLVYFLSPSGMARDLEELNYIVTVWDLCHRDDPEFPEVRLDREFERRDELYKSVLPRATAVFVDSEVGRLNVVSRYALDAVRVHVMPFEAAIFTRHTKDHNPLSSIDIHDKYSLDFPYVFYPAQFWAHKNHVYILMGLEALKQIYGIEIGAVFSGSDKGNIEYIRSKARELDLQEKIRFIGFVDSSEMCELYCNSIALVMPTYFGPTNMPPLEAFELGVPVLYPNKLGLREQVGNAALLMDLKNPKSMSYHLKQLVENPDLRHKLVSAGRDCLVQLNSIDRIDILQTVVSDFQWRRLCWK